MKLKVTVNGTAYDVDVEVEQSRPSLGDMGVIGAYTGPAPTAPVTTTMPAASANQIVAPLAGSVARIMVEVGDEIKAGQVLVLLEAMKMETEITAPADGTVGGVLVEVGEAVQGGQALIAMA
ncbi:methylmalonyl-CoA carboxyltransferase 1.3S subunit [Raineyella antarctica]|uniref:Methylmalonyl-CoA carboxyltransferase 1.3S subunit n=1 Tax=Raineyella antarctica TaxID=1577474 RepID=A0A1G6GE84_9ACTN|nr:biotin/lipoyl-containing protein [Raineyella antarctica]SDB80274.1 methylmalonyl-CoA carboxyltransferase 1.3S subunit [Raineyella antarctica]